MGGLLSHLFSRLRLREERRGEERRGKMVKRERR
jgi:hypothetical protein